MAKALTDDQLRQTGLAALESKLGAVDALRFLALLRHEPFNYQARRQKTLEGLSIGELFHRFEQSSEVHRIQVPLINTNRPATVNLTEERIEELLNE